MDRTLTLLALLATSSAFAWGPDVPLNNYANEGRYHALEATNGDIVVAVADTMPNDGVLVSFTFSSDGGLSWGPAAYQITGNGVTPRVKLVRSASTMYCLYLDGDTVRIYNTTTGVTGAYLDYAAEEFDGVMTQLGWLYLFIQLPGTDDIRRAGSNDGGLTWGGDMASVTGLGAVPRVSISPGDTIILNYYGPVLADRPKSKLRAAYYNQVAPGDLDVSPGSFIDIVADVNVDKWRFGSAIHGGKVWFFWEQGLMGSRVLLCRISSNNGMNYGTAFQVAGGPGEDISGFTAVARAFPPGSRLELAYARYTTPGQNDPLLDRLVHNTALSSAPSIFGFAANVSEHAPTEQPIAGAPSLVAMNAGGLGAVWAGHTSSSTDLYWSMFDGTTSVAMQAVNSNVWVQNPVHDQLTIHYSAATNMTWTMRDAIGRVVLSGTIPSGSEMREVIDVSRLATGMHVLELGTGSERMRFVKE